MQKTRRGRPPRVKSERLNLLLSPEEYNDIQRAADILKISKAEVVRRGVARIVRTLKSNGQWEASNNAKDRISENQIPAENPEPDRQG